ncbi:hypothetical protein N665_1360s0007 [Sinapis alba]|nr:hypothetical protein N665_1360s0007 [Sinapis alba]
MAASGVVNTLWEKACPKFFVHNVGQDIFLLCVTNSRTRELLMSRTSWNIAEQPLFVALWSPDLTPEEAPLTNVMVSVKICDSLSQIETTNGKPVSLAPETERKENVQVTKTICFTNGREVDISVLYPWLPVNCDLYKKYGHTTKKC